MTKTNYKSCKYGIIFYFVIVKIFLLLLNQQSHDPFVSLFKFAIQFKTQLSSIHYNASGRSSSRLACPSSIKQKLKVQKEILMKSYISVVNG